MINSYFITVDAETDLVLEGVRQISRIRERLEQGQEYKIPITWFVRFQRNWTDSVDNESLAFFESPVQRTFDGFSRLEPVLDELRDRGDEIGWHYHAYHYVLRDELSHEVKVNNIAADLVSCAAVLRSTYPELQMSAFRWGWFFLPDVRLQSTLRDLGFDVDASIFPGRCGKNVSGFSTLYPEPPTLEAACIDNIHYFPFRNTLLTHDYEVVAHDLGWSKKSEQQAEQSRTSLAGEMLRLVRDARSEGKGLTTYRDAVRRAQSIKPSRGMTAQ